MRIQSTIVTACLAVFLMTNALCGQDVRRTTDGRGNHSRTSPATNLAPPAGTNGITYHNGPVMLGTTHIYYIWYGDWSTDAAANNIITNFGNNIGGSPYFNINTSYTDSSNTAVTNAVTLVGSITDHSTATSLSDANIWSIVTRAFGNGMAVDPNGVYFVLTAPGVTATSGFLTQYCGWHTYNNYNGTAIKYAFVGNAKGPNLGNCAIQTSQSPNADPAADAMVSVIAHELEESVSDPQLNAWYDSNGEENADKCAWTFGTTYSAGNGSVANMKLGAMDYLIQRNWLNASGGTCALSYGGVANDFSLSITPATQTVLRGNATSNYAIAVTDTGSFNSSVAFGVSGLPSGVTLKTAPASSATASVFSLNVAASTAPGTYSLTITGASGSLSHTALATLIVTAMDFGLAVTPASQTVLRGNVTGSYTIAVNKIGSFASPVSFQVTGLPAGASLKTAPAASATASAFSVNVPATVAAGSYPLTVTGASGSLVHTASAALVVTSGDFTLAVTPASQSAAQGGVTGNYTITVSKIGTFASAVAFQVTGLPSGATLKTQPAISVTTATFSVNVPVTVAAGSYSLTITGTSGSLAHTASATLAVTAADFGLVIAPASQTVAQGGVTPNYSIAVNKIGNFASAVSFQVTGLPSGASLKTTPGSSVTASTFTVNVPTTVVAGTYPLTIIGTSGSLTHTASASLVVTAGKLFGIAVTPGAMAVTQGNSGSVTLTLTTANGFSSPIQLTITGLPSGTTPTIQGGPSSSPTTATATLTIATSASTPKGTFSVTLTGKSGALTSSAMVALTVR